MKKMILSGWLILLFAQIVCAQEKIEAPIWNVGDKWVFTQGITIGVINKDEDNYKVKFQNETLLLEKLDSEHDLSVSREKATHI